ncbi:MAG: coproporphyrinogen III oxidase [Myxococcota bacterium]|jgi:coproporphyrinogen III oxidase
MPGTPARSGRAAAALTLVDALQLRLADRLAAVGGSPFVPVEWLRDEGRHGGGVRLVAPDGPVFDRASVNVSAIHYDDLPDKRLASATALSAIVHPANPAAPSMHTHVSWTELRDGAGTWRIMGDLNPSNPAPPDTAAFVDALREAAGPHFDGAAAQGDRYFTIPALDRHRGVAHFYLEGFSTGDWDADAAFATRVAHGIIDTYGDILDDAVDRTVTDAMLAAQRHYHTVYLFQVLTLDRGTTSGLLVHDQNDVGILGSLPSTVDRDLLASWASLVPEPQPALVRALVHAIPPTGRIDVPAKRELAAAVRAHYLANPAALDLQARGDVLPPTVANHQ